jgi:hypothetical protein
MGIFLTAALLACMNGHSEERDWPVWLAETEGSVHPLLRPAANNVLLLWPGLVVRRPIDFPAR